MSSKNLPLAQEHEQHGVAVAPAKPELKKPRQYKVVILNDDYTPMDFVVDVLCRFFGKDQEQAVRIMLQVHTEGKGVCGIYRFEIAETKAAQVVEYAKTHQHPLQSALEAV